MKHVWTRTFAFTSFTWLNTREHTRACVPAPLTWKYNLSMGVASEKQHVGVMASSNHYTPILEHNSTRLKSTGFQVRLILTPQRWLKHADHFSRIPHINPIMASVTATRMWSFMMKMYSTCASLRTHFANYLSRIYLYFNIACTQ